MKLVKIERVPNGLDTVRIEGRTYHVRFTARSARHINENYLNAAHQITYDEIVALLKESAIMPGHRGSKQVALGRFGKKIYETYFRLERDRLDVVTSFACNKPDHLFQFRDYENKR